MAEEKQVIETTEKQTYITKAIDRGKNYTTIKCQLDLDAFKSNMFIGFNNKSNTCAGTLNSIKPAGWTIVDNSSVNIKRTIELEGPTALEVILRCAEVYGVCFRFNTSTMIVTIINPESFAAVGAFITEDLNLKELNYMGKSNDLFTRIYAVGKEGLTFASINAGKNYVDNNSYTNKVISYYWKDERYTDKESLLLDAKKKLKTAAIPAQSYECTVMDLKNALPEKYGFLDFSLFSVATLIDKVKGTRIDHQVVENTEYPYYPEKNTITLSNVAPSIQSTVKNIQDSLTTPNSGFQQQMQALLNTLGESISGELGGNMAITHNTNGKPNGIKIMDTDDMGTAQKILWLNLNGITYSEDGGQNFKSVWSFAKGGFIADWLIAGTIDANLIKIRNLIVDHLESTSGIYAMSAWAAILKIMDGLNCRVKIYATKPVGGETLGILQVFKGLHREDGTRNSDSRYGYLTPSSLGIGEKSDGTYDGHIYAGTVHANALNVADQVYIHDKLVFKGYYVSRTPISINGKTYNILTN